MNDSNNLFKERPGKTSRPLSIHQVVRADLKAWLDGELPPGRCWYVRLHLFCCRECREEVKWLKRLGEDMRELEQAVPGPNLRARILAALPDSPPCGSIRPTAFRPVWPRYALSGMSAVLVLGAAAFAATHVGRHRSSKTHAPLVSTSEAPGLAKRDPSPAAPSVPNSSDTQYTQSPITDPTTLAANALSDRQEEDKAKREGLKLSQNRSNWSKMVAALHKLETNKDFGKSQHLNLSLSVPDVAEAQERLQAWANAARAASGIQPQPDTSVRGAAPGVPVADSGTSAIPVPTQYDLRTVTLRVPVNQIASLQPVVQRMGAWDRQAVPIEIITPAGTTWNPASAQPVDRGPGRPPKPVRTDATTDKSNGSGADNAPRIAGAVRPAYQSVGHDSGPILITLQVRLNSLDSYLP